MIKKIKTAVEVVGEFVILGVRQMASVMETSRYFVVGMMTITIAVLLIALAFKGSFNGPSKESEVIYNLSQALKDTSFKAYIK